MEIKKIYCLVLTGLAILTFIGCEKDQISYFDRPVVEAYLIPGGEPLVKVYYQKDLNDTITYGVLAGGLNLTISDGTTQVPLTEDSTGYYRIHDANFIAAGKQYSLAFNFSGVDVSAQTTVPMKPGGFSTSSSQVAIPEFSPGLLDTATFKSVRLSWLNPEGNNYMIVFRNQEQDPSPVNSRFTIDDPVYDTEADAGTASYYDIQLGTFRYLGNYKAVLLRVNSEYKEMLQNNGTSSQNLTNPPTNIKNGLGIFTGMNADTINIAVVKK